MSQRRANVFLERETYRKRRLLDAARVLPILGVALLLVPLLWQPGTVPLSWALIYLFGVWGLLILCAILFAIKVRAQDDEDAPPRPGGAGR